MLNEIHCLVILFLMTGLLILNIDVKGYDMAEMPKEKKVARVLGWINVSLGLIVFLINGLYQTWYW